MQVVSTIEALREARAALTGRTGLVPTMGALHIGHRQLVEQARAENDHVIVTIFVNPTQFGPNEDFTAYPRDLPADLNLLRAAGADMVFTPDPSVIYPAGFQTAVEVGEIASVLEGAHRPGHFRGVTTVVAKLFNLTQPHITYFGQKDAQQVAVIRRMVYDLNFPVEVAIVPTVREADGLAMSSRNRYLSPQQRSAATVLYRAMRAAANAYGVGERNPERLRAIMQETLKSELAAQTVYVSAADAATLQELSEPGDRPILLSLAVQVGKARLIDNMLLPVQLNTREGLRVALGRPNANHS